MRQFMGPVLTWLLGRSWDEKKVCEWLRGINCAQYEQLFRGMATLLTPHDETQCACIAATVNFKLVESTY